MLFLVNLLYLSKSNFNFAHSDNGRVVEYDNSHDYQELVERFKDDIKEFVQW